MGGLALDLLFPRRCVGCGRYGDLLCRNCAASLSRALPPRCPRCWQPWAAGSVCLSCQEEPPSFDGATTPYIYEGTARKALWALKYDGVSALAGPMGHLMAEHWEQAGITVDVVVPVPLHPRRRRQRGYNQSALLAREVARRCGLPLAEESLRRIRMTPPQMRTTDLAQRRHNVAGAFAAGSQQVKGQRVLLIDDVMTSGATLDACAKALRQGGARSVWGLTFARD